MWISLILCLLVQLTVVIEGQYRVLVTIHSFVLFESRCAKCYVGNSTTPQSGLCCDGSNESCPNSCDILIAFRQNNSGDTSQFYLEGTLGHDFKANEVQRYNKTGKIGFQSFAPINPLQYGIETLDQVGEQLNVSVYDEDVDDSFDLIDKLFIIVKNSSVTVHTGIYNYTQLELSIEVVENHGECVIEDEQPKCECKPGFTGDHCECLNASDCQNGTICMNQEADGHRCECYLGFTGIFCETNIDECIGITCNNGGMCVDGVSDYQCECPFGFTDTHCEDIINYCSGVTCSGRGECVNEFEVKSFSCACYPGYTGEKCEFKSGVTSTAPVTHDGSVTTAVGVISTAPVTHNGSAATAAIIGGAVGGAVVLALAIFLAAVLLVMLTRIQRRTKAYDAQGNTHAFNSNEVVLHSGDVYICKDTTSKKTSAGESEIVREFDNPVYGGDAVMELTTNNACSEVTYSNQDQESDSERKFVNPIYGADDNDNSHTHNANFNSAIPEHEDTDYDQVGNIYHTLESNEDREERYAQASQAAMNSVDISSSGQ